MAARQNEPKPAVTTSLWIELWPGQTFIRSLERNRRADHRLMSRLSASIRLRPVRFAFLVSPADKTALRRIFEINTCLWGGKFNPIISAISRVPSWWDRHSKSLETATQILNGYIDFFEPDLLVEPVDGLGKQLGFDEDLTISLDDILIRIDDPSEQGRGLDVLDLYRNLYEKEFQFSRRHDHGIIRVKAKKSAMQDFSACLFGDFPDSAEHSYFESAFTDAFDPKQIELDGAAFCRRTVRGNSANALRGSQRSAHCVLPL